MLLLQEKNIFYFLQLMRLFGQNSLASIATDWRILQILQQANQLGQ
jgi:hypothetical protein